MSNKFSTKNCNFEKKFTLNMAKRGQTCKILRCSLPHEVKLRLYEMGLTPGTTVTIVKRAPLGDPLEIALLGYSLCIRAREARFFEVAQ